MKKFIILIDCQVDFISGALANPDAQKKISRLCTYINEQRGDVDFLYTLDTHSNNYMETLEGINLPVPHCIKDTPGWCLDPSIGEALMKRKTCGDRVEGITKETFGSVHLMEYFKNMRAQEHDIEIEVAGFCSDICVISNLLLLRAALPNTKITCRADLCSGVTKELHDAAIAIMKSCQISVEGEE